jgi:signal transduction histidine kinase
MQTALNATEEKAYMQIKNTKALHLTQKENNYLKEKKTIVLCVQRDFMPYEDLKKDQNAHLQYQGILSSYFDLFSQMLNIQFVFKDREVLEDPAQTCDILSSVETLDAKQKENFLLSDPYMVSPLVVVTKSTEPFISDFNNLNHTPFGISQNFNYIKALKQTYTNINALNVSTVREGFHKVHQGKLFGQIGTLADAAYFFQTDFKGELKITGKTDLVALALHMAVNKNDPLLNTIMNKAINNLDPSVHYNILSKWTSIRYEQGFDYSFIIKITLLFLSIIFIISIFLMVLRGKNKKLKQASDEILYLNQTLEQRVKDEVEKNRQHQLMLMQQSRLAKMGELATMIAHQWRQPLGSINNAIIDIQLNFMNGRYDLSKQEDVEGFKNYLEDKFKKMNIYSKFLSDTIDEFIYFYQPSKKKEKLSLTAVIDETAEMIKESFTQKNIQLSFNYQAPCQLEIYKNEFMQVIQNLLKNAEENFIEQKTSKPCIYIETFYSSDTRYHIKICDNGGGIPEENLDTIFDPYFSTKNVKNNTGLGLYMSKMILREHFEGDIEASNCSKYHGACFEIILNPEYALEMHN